MLLGVLVFAGLLAYGDFKDVGHSLDDFRWELFPLILLVTCGNYLLRFVKWEYYLRAIGVRGLARLDSFLIFFSGLGMVVTPGKVGEWLKSYLLRELHGTPFTRSAPILLAERMTDSLALLILGGAGVLLYGNNTWPYIAIIAAFSLLAIAVSRHRPTAHGLLGLLARLPFIGRFAPRFEEMYESTYVLMDPRAVVSMTLLSVVSWSFEVLAFYLTLVGVGADAGFDTLSKAAFILPISTLAAAIFLTPGGLIVAEIGITKLSQDLVDLTKSAATVATLIIRVATLWFGVVVGLIAFAFVTQRLNRLGKHLGDPDSADAPNPQSPLPAND
jgi:uncharacterized membrane protein YbhN (UPF0104 family)